MTDTKPVVGLTHMISGFHIMVLVTIILQSQAATAELMLATCGCTQRVM